ncbi:sulfite exporter TauE/SafE family protein [Paraburkholderia sp. CNPSo 3274]|uniref:sulfite exporter TauE/SafE family protein n=1 Tax=Paraburkholderia sp. CNPSo 3274 TaxID=2940932 RepID=UPI0020B7CB12|nr:sulfite exporter TauE/SafE family protein [Paraburkholderia sp. CNPSo 3274]MCP3705840.1 sulfite exporter TauE/SafE family protein [Paraburkholderia sp. CNPSo 3274]
MNTMALVFSAGMAAGAMNALAGGGSFVSLPALIAAGVPPVQANTSSTVALFPGGLASAWAYRDGLRPVGAVSLRALLATTLCGGFAGALLLLWTSPAAFTFVLPWLLLVASIALAFGRRIGEALRARWHIHANAVLAVQFMLGVYGGYFGGAVGIMMIAIWGLLDNSDLKHLNAPRTLLVSAANMVAVLAFIVANAVHWPETLVMLVGAIIGGYSGARIGCRAPPRIIRAITLLVTSCITLVFFVKTYAPMLLHR